MPVHVVDHPLIRHKITILRSIKSDAKVFRELVDEITLLLAYEATRGLGTTPREVITPMGLCTGDTLTNSRLVVAPIMRAGLGMVRGMTNIIPFASIAHLGLYRDETTFEPKIYYQSMPRGLEDATVFIVDPMLATAGSMSAAVDLVKKEKPGRIICIALIAAPEGRERMDRDHPEIDVYVAAMDSHLNENAYIIPGLGDAGDRMFGSFKVEPDED